MWIYYAYADNCDRPKWPQSEQLHWISLPPRTVVQQMWLTGVQYHKAGDTLEILLRVPRLWKGYSSMAGEPGFDCQLVGMTVIHDIHKSPFNTVFMKSLTLEKIMQTWFGKMGITHEN